MISSRTFFEGAVSVFIRIWLTEYSKVAAFGTTKPNALNEVKNSVIRYDKPNALNEVKNSVIRYDKA